jgi:hypothetical protein
MDSRGVEHIFMKMHGGLSLSEHHRLPVQIKGRSLTQTGRIVTTLALQPCSELADSVVSVLVRPMDRPQRYLRRLLHIPTAIPVTQQDGGRISIGIA